MSGRVSVFLPVAGGGASARDRFTGDPGRWLPESRAHGPSRWHATVRYHGLTRVVEVRVGAVWSVGDTLWRSLSWVPVPDDRDVGAIDRLLPRLTAELGLHVKDDAASLVLSGAYDPPGAILGDLADAVLLHRVSERTARAFLEDVAPLLATREAPVPA